MIVESCTKEANTAQWTLCEIYWANFLCFTKPRYRFHTPHKLAKFSTLPF